MSKVFLSIISRIYDVLEMYISFDKVCLILMDAYVFI